MRNVSARAGRRIVAAGAVAVAAVAITVSAVLALTAAQADRGEIAFAQSCALCHGPNGDDGFAPAVSGPQSLRRFDSVRAVYDFVRQNMPFSAPGSLDDQTYLDVVAYLLSTRGIAPDGEELSATTLDTTPLDPPATRELRVVATEHIAPDPNLAHNLMDLELQIDGQTVPCGFRRHYYATGGLTRWGFPTSEVLEERGNVFTQYYQRGAVDCHQRGGGMAGGTASGVGLHRRRAGPVGGSGSRAGSAESESGNGRGPLGSQGVECGRRWHADWVPGFLRGARWRERLRIPEERGAAGRRPAGRAQHPGRHARVHPPGTSSPR